MKNERLRPRPPPARLPTWKSRFTPPSPLPPSRTCPCAILTYRAPLGTQAMNSLLRKSSLVTRGALRCLPAPATHRLDDRQTRMFAGRDEQNAHNFGTEPHAPSSHTITTWLPRNIGKQTGIPKFCDACHAIDAQFSHARAARALALSCSFRSENSLREHQN